MGFWKKAKGPAGGSGRAAGRLKQYLDAMSRYRPCSDKELAALFPNSAGEQRVEIIRRLKERGYTALYLRRESGVEYMVEAKP